MGLMYDQLFPGRFIKAGEMRSKPLTLTIKDVYLDGLEQEDGTEKSQAVVSFEEIKREWALNKTNAQCLVAMWGRDSGDWIGHKVTIYPEHDASGLSDSGVCIRVKGSPELTKTVTAQIKLPRRRPVARKLVPTGKDEGGATLDTDEWQGDAPDDKDEPPGMDAEEARVKWAADEKEADGEDQQRF